MNMRLSFDSIDEVREFVKGLKGTRGGKAGDGDETSTDTKPLQPPVGGAATLAGPGANAGFPNNAGGGFPGGATGIDPAVQGVVTRIVTKLDASLAAGNSADAALTWFRSHFGPEAAQATLDQIKQIFLARLPVAKLEDIAKMMGA
jgi:hypothetical protein